MFQKLYRHLEDMKNSLCRQELAAGTSSAYEKEILQQLNVLNETIKSSKLDLQGAVKKPSTVFPVVIAVMACLAIGAIVFLNVQLAALTRGLAGNQQKVNLQIQSQSEAARDRLNLYGQQKIEAAQLSRLDSIISEESQALLELKDLNKISVRTFMRLKSRVDQTDRLLQSRQSDTGRYVGRTK